MLIAWSSVGSGKGILKIWNFPISSNVQKKGKGVENCFFFNIFFLH